LSPRVQVDKTLVAEQRAADFKPREDGSLQLERPTSACALATALLGGAWKVAQQMLRGVNLHSYLREVRAAPTLACSLGPDHCFDSGAGRR
jgi:hypothetical protein